jgi:hypothetical protein
MNELDISQLNTKINKSIDIFFCSASFEERSLVIANEIDKARIKKSFVCFNIDQDGILIENKNKLLAILPGSLELKLHSDDSLYLTNNLTECLINLKDGENTNVFIDSTTFTHEALLILIKLVKTILPNTEITIGYIGAEKYSFNVEKAEDKWLTKGVKDVRTIIGYSGYFDFTQKTHLIILFGFEIERTIKIIETFEPNEVSIGLGTEDYSINTDHYKINIERHKKLKELYPFIKTFEVSLKDPFVSRDQIIKQFDLFPNHNKIISPLNTKISTVGAALAQEINNDIQICYAKGNIYNKDGYAKSSKKLYLFSLK